MRLPGPGRFCQARDERSADASMRRRPPIDPTYLRTDASAGGSG